MPRVNACANYLSRQINCWDDPPNNHTLSNPINIKPDGIFYIIDVVKVKRNYIAIGLILGLALGIATRKLVVGLAIGLMVGFIINSLQNRKEN